MKRHLLYLLALLNISTVYAADTDIVINELMASNAGVVMSPAYNFDSWIEFYNPTGQPVNLAGMYLSNNADNLMRWQIPCSMVTCFPWITVCHYSHRFLLFSVQTVALYGSQA